MSMKLEYVAALDELGRLDLGTLPDLAIDWLIEGIESESLMVLAGESNYASNNPTGLRDQFRAVLEELGIRLPTPVQAAIVVRDKIARDVVSGSVFPADGAYSLVELQQQTELDFPAGPHVGNGLGVAIIYALSDSYDDVYGETIREELQARAEIDAEIIEACQQLIAARKS